MEPKPAQINTNPHNKKILVIGLILVIASTALALGWYYYSLNQPKQIKVLTKPKIIKEKSAVQQLVSGHPQIYYVNLEYSLDTSAITIISKGKMNGSPPIFLPSPPNQSKEMFIYKVEVISDENEVLHSGWVSEFKSLIEFSPRKYSLVITSTYKPKATIRLLSVKDELIWLGKIE